MAVIKVHTDAIGFKGTKPVVPTTFLTKKGNDLMIKILESGNIETESAEDALKALKLENELINSSLNFIQTALKLTDKQIEKVENSVPEVGLTDYVGYLVQRIKGVPESAFADESKKEKAPKRQPNGKN